MDPVTPNKPRGFPAAAAGDDHTDVSTPPAPWDPRDGDPEDGEGEGGEEPRITAPTASITPGDYDLAPGTRLGEYQIEARIGQGGMGVVFAAVHPLIGKRAAIKILKKELCADPHTVQRFVDEARVVNQIGHPNIVDIFAFGEMPDGRSYFVMEWLKGETLRARMDRGRVPLAEACRIVKQLARALAAAHEKGVVHRDLKPDNIFLVEMRDDPPTVKLLDFGIAKLAGSEHRVEKTATGAIVGTPQYIAPEQAKGYTIDFRADIYALGGIVFELLAGRPPFVADNAMEMVAKHLMEPPVRVSTLAPDVPPALDQLVDQMLAKQPDRRPSLTTIVEVLERARDRAATHSEPFSRPSLDARASIEHDVASAVSAPVPVPSLRRSRRGWLLAGVPIAALGAFLIVRAVGGPAGSSSPPSSPSSQVAAPAPEPAPSPALASETPARAAVTPALAPVTPAPPPVRPPVAKQAPAAAKQEPVRVPPPPAVAKPVRARLRLTIVGGGPGTDVRIDNAPGSTDALLPLGTHTVEVRAKGMVPQRLTVEVGRGGTTRKITLVPKPPVDDGKELILPGTIRSK